jgi:hypothetical protein
MRSLFLGSAAIVASIALLSLGQPGAWAQGAKAEAEAGTAVSPPATTQSGAASAETQVQGTDGTKRTQQTMHKESTTVGDSALSTSKTTRRTETEEATGSDGGAKAKTSTSTSTTSGASGGSGAKAEAGVETQP